MWCINREWKDFFFFTLTVNCLHFSTDSGWDNPFRPDGDLSREADEIVELIKGGKPITPTPGQNAPPLPGCDGKSDSSPLLKSGNYRPGQENGSAHGGTPSKSGNQPVNEKVKRKKHIAYSTFAFNVNSIMPGVFKIWGSIELNY